MNSFGREFCGRERQCDVSAAWRLLAALTRACTLSWSGAAPPPLPADM